MKVINLNSRFDENPAAVAILKSLLYIINHWGGWPGRFLRIFQNTPVYLVAELPEQKEEKENSDKPGTDWLGMFTTVSCLVPRQNAKTPVIYLSPESIAECSNDPMHYLYLFVKVALHELAHALLYVPDHCLPRDAEYKLMEESLCNMFALLVIQDYSHEFYGHGDPREAGMFPPNFTNDMLEYCADFVQQQPFEYALGYHIAIPKVCNGLFHQWKNIKQRSRGIQSETGLTSTREIVLHHFRPDGGIDPTNFKTFRGVLNGLGRPF